MNYSAKVPFVNPPISTKQAQINSFSLVMKIRQQYYCGQVNYMDLTI